MHTPKRRSASPHIGRLRPLTPSARTLLQSLPPCAHRGYFAKRPMAVARLGGRAQRTASFAGLAKRTQPTGRNRHLSRWLAERTRRADRSPFVRSTRPPAPVCPGKPDQAHRHDVGQTNPSPRHRRSQSLLPLGSMRLLAFRLKILLYFSCCLQGRLFLRSLWLCRLSAFEKTSPSQSPDRKEPAARSSRDSRAILAERTQGGSPVSIWPNDPKGQPVTPVAKQTQGAPSHDFG